MQKERGAPSLDRRARDQNVCAEYYGVSLAEVDELDASELLLDSVVELLLLLPTPLDEVPELPEPVLLPALLPELFGWLTLFVSVELP